MKMLKTVMGAGLGAALLASAAIAGQTQPAPVDVDLAMGFAQGDMLTARDDDDDDVFIGCGVREFDDGAGGAFSFGFCQAEDAAAEAVLCFTTNTDLLDAIRASSDRSFITFSFVDDGAGGFNCTRIGFSNQSFYLEKLKSN